MDQGANFSQPPAYSSTQFPPLYTPYNPQQSEDVGSTQDREKPRNKFDNHKYNRDDFINLFDYNNQPANSQEPIPNYDQDYYSLNEVALGSELHKHTFDEKEHQNIDRIDNGEYEYYDYENENSNYDDKNENDSLLGVRFGGGIIDFAESYTCSGNMMLIHTNTTSDEAQNLNGIKTVRLSGKKYPNLPRRILRESRKLLYSQTTGDCCWQFNSKKSFRGEFQFATPGFEGLPRWRPKSIKKVECDRVF